VSLETADVERILPIKITHESMQRIALPLSLVGMIGMTYLFLPRLVWASRTPTLVLDGAVLLTIISLQAWYLFFLTVKIVADPSSTTVSRFWGCLRWTFDHQAVRRVEWSGPGRLIHIVLSNGSRVRVSPAANGMERVDAILAARLRLR
jgi:hypothetical protein